MIPVILRTMQWLGACRLGVEYHLTDCTRRIYEVAKNRTTRINTTVIKSGNSDIIHWLLRLNCPKYAKMGLGAVKTGNLPAIMNLDLTLNWAGTLISAATCVGDVAIMRYVHRKWPTAYKFPSCLMCAAISNDQIHAFQWLYQFTNEHLEDGCISRARTDENFAMLRAIFEYRGRIPMMVTINAIYDCNVPLLEWLMRIGMRFPSDAEIRMYTDMHRYIMTDAVKAIIERFRPLEDCTQDSL